MQTFHMDATPIKKTEFNAGQMKWLQAHHLMIDDFMFITKPLSAKTK